MAHKITINGVNTDHLPKLSKQQSEELMQKLKKGDEKAREYFIMANLRLVLSIVHRFHCNNSQSDDLFQVGCLGLIKALNNFDPKFNVMFSTYAVPMIVGEIKRYIREQSLLKVGRQIRDVAYRAMQAKEQLMQKKGYDEPSLYEIAEEMQVDVKEVVASLDALQQPVSLYEPIYSDGESNALVMDSIGDKKNNEKDWIKRISLKDAIEKLNDKEKSVIRLRYYEGKTQIEVSKIKGISQAQVSRLENTALLKLRKELSD